MEKLIVDLAVRHLHSAGKIPLIKFTRELTLLPLKEAKYLVEDLASKHQIILFCGTFGLESEVTQLRNDLKIAQHQIEELKQALHDVSLIASRTFRF